MTRPAIIINELDAERIDRLLEQPAFANSPVADALNDELDRAQMLAPEAMPHDVVSMNSQVRFRDLTTGEERIRTLVFPAQVTDSATQLSVMAPVGAALLGLKVGSTIHWNYRAAPQRTLKCWNCCISRRPLAISTVNLPRCLKRFALYPEDVTASSFCIFRSSPLF
ncbi:Regulator of nucleoside diphosphate kinase [Klebsiella michiganensis]|uniref:Regulator of nucleoside diphosphate kinase n=2 Tax=Klebsiella TaxID=570 RepID=A0A7H4LXI0_9ENTR|nr:Regulator of nucleoside diphosphate kinase [Klebsiella michiganensis]